MVSINDDNQKLVKWIWVVSIAIPVVVAILLYMPSKLAIDAEWVRILPHFNAVINSLTAIILVTAVVSVKNGKIDLHKKLMSSAFVLGGLFLVCYVVYHASVDSVVYGDLNGDGILSEEELAKVGSFNRGFYLGLLLTHILLAIVVVPFVLMAFYFALTDRINKHKAIVKFTFPIWLIVSVSGVIVYYMISAYY